MLRHVLRFAVVTGLFILCQGIFVFSPAGVFLGRVLSNPNRGFQLAYLGIPYAKPPVGALRFAKPQALPRLQGIYRARYFGPICVQPADFEDRGQEDCLTLNVFTPIKYSRRLKKVLVYVHGGGGVSGSSKEYIPGDIVTKKNIVVVTLNYRLGFLGFLRGNPEQLPGNQALWDVLLALNWIKDNIRSFGGNPDQVTFSGQGMGGYIGVFLSISPLAKGLFRRGIFMSTGFSPYPFLPTTSTDMLTEAINKFGCSQSGQSLNLAEATVCLKSIPALNFDAQFTFRSFSGLVSSEDEILPERPPELWTDPVYLSDVGFSSRDYILEIGKDDGIYAFDSRLQRLNISTSEQALLTLASALGQSLSTMAVWLQPYRALNPRNDFRAITDFFTDLFLTAKNTFLQAFENATAAESRPGEAYLMSFDHEPSYMPGFIFPRSLELAYLFDITPQRVLEISYPRLTVQGPFRREDRLLKSSFISLVADFVKTGNPGLTLSRRDNINWPPHKVETKPYLSFSPDAFVDFDLAARRLAG